MATTNFNLRLEQDLRDKAFPVFERYGLSASQAFKLFLTQVAETNKMIAEENLDVRTITLGISLMECIDSDLEKLKINEIKKIAETHKIELVTKKDGKSKNKTKIELIHEILTLH